MRKTRILLVALLAVLAVTVPAQVTSRARTAGARTRFGKLPLCFVENRGVYPEAVAYYIQGADRTLFFGKEGITIRLEGRERGWAVKLDFVGANPEVRPEGRDRRPAMFSYFKGPAKDWRVGLPTFSSVVYRDLWPGIDLVYRGTVSKLKYEFLVAPGADPQRIRLRYRGATSVTIMAVGALKVETPEGAFEDAPPVAWQDVDGRRMRVEMAYRVDPDGDGEGTTFGFAIGDYDRTQPLVLDPAMLVYCGYIGGSGDDVGGGVALDAAGNVYLSGSTTSAQPTFPVRVGPSLTYGGHGSLARGDVFVAKMDPTGRTLLFCGYIGGAGDDIGGQVGVDAAGNVYVAGWTTSDENSFPVTVGPDLTHNGHFDGFVAKVDPTGRTLLYCGYVGGALQEYAGSLAVDAAGHAYLSGSTQSDQTTFPVCVGPDLSYNGGSGWGDAFVAKVDPTGKTLLYCGYIGGSGNEIGHGIDIDAAGSAYITGETRSTEATLPVTVGPDLTYNGGTRWGDAFVAKVSPSGQTIVYCGYIGGAGSEEGISIAVDTAGSAYVTGYTQSSESTFPATVGPGLAYKGGDDAFIAKVIPSGHAFVYCGYIGGSGAEWGLDVAVSASGVACVVGFTGSSESTFPVHAGPDITYNGGSRDGFVAKVDPSGKTLMHCGYVGGAGDDSCSGITFDASGSTYVSGGTTSTQSTFPVRTGPGLIHGGASDLFVAKIALTMLSAGGCPRPGGTVALDLTATDDAGLSYQLGTSLGTGPIAIGNRQIDLSADGLLVASVLGSWPSVFSGYRGVIDSTGRAKAAIRIPNDSRLLGIRLHTAFVTLGPSAPSGIRSVSNAMMFSIAK